MTACTVSNIYTPQCLILSREESNQLLCARRIRPCCQPQLCISCKGSGEDIPHLLFISLLTVPLKLLLPLLFPILKSIPFSPTHSLRLLCHFLSITASATRIHDLAWRPAIESGPTGNVLFPSLLLHLPVWHFFHHLGPILSSST